MKTTTRNLLMTLAAGVLGLALRYQHLSTADPARLLPKHHVLGILVLLITLGMLAVLFILTRSLTDDIRYARLFPLSLLRGLGCAVAAGGILFSAIRELTVQSDSMRILCLVFAAIAAISLAFLAYCRVTGTHPAVWFHAAVCIYFIFHLIFQYRRWCSQPQLSVYLYPLLASVCLMLATYHLAALDGRQGGRKNAVFFCLAAVLLCSVSLAAVESRVFYSACLLWMATGLPSGE